MINYNITQTTNLIINLLLLDNFYPIISYTDEFKKTAANYCTYIYGSVTRYGPQSVASAIGQIGDIQGSRNQTFVSKIEIIDPFAAENHLKTK